MLFSWRKQATLIFTTVCLIRIQLLVEILLSYATTHLSTPCLTVIFTGVHSTGNTLTLKFHRLIIIQKTDVFIRAFMFATESFT